MAKRGRPSLQLSVSERLERRRAQLARSQRKSRARRRCCSPSSLPLSPPHGVSQYETSSSSSEDPTCSITPPPSSTWQQPGAGSSAMNPQPPESHQDDFSWTEAVLGNSPASPNFNILESSEAHPLSRVLEAVEYEHHTPLEFDATDDSVFLPNFDDYGDSFATASTSGCSLSVFPAMLNNGSRTPTTPCTSAKEATFLSWLVPEGDDPNSLLYLEMGLDPSFTTIPGENHHIFPEQSHYTTEGSHVGDLINDNWASSPFIPSSDSFSLDAPLSDRQEWDTILQPTGHPLTMRRGFDNCRTVRLILTLAV